MFRTDAKSFLLVLLILFSTSLVGWQHQNHRPSSRDETRHMKLAMDYRAWILKAVPLTDEWSHVYPPAYHFSIIPALSVGRPSEAKATATHVVYALFFIAGCLLLGRQYWRPDWESVLGAFVCLGYVWVLWASRRALIDFPLMAWVTFSMAMLARTDGFSSLARSLAWGVAVGIGLLLKPPFVLFVAGPVVWVLVTSHHVEKFKNLHFALLLSGAIAVPWYFWEGAYFISKASRLAVESQGPGMDPRTLAGWLFYLRLLPFQMGTPSFIVTAIGILLAFLRRPRAGHGLFVVWFLSAYFFLSLLINKDPRHTLALLPPLAILAARGWGRFAEDIGSPFLIGLAGPLLMAYNVWAFDRPATQGWMHEPILHLMTERHDPHQPFMLASVLAHSEFFFARTLKWSAMQQGIDLDMVGPGDSDASFPEFVIRRLGSQGTETAELERQWQSFRPSTRAFTALFSKVRSFTLPDNSQVDVYQRQAHPRFNVEPLSAAEVERRLARTLGRWAQGSLHVSVEARPESLQEGRLERVRISCTPCEVWGVRIQKVDLVVEKPWINLYRLWDENRLGLLAFESLKPRIELADREVTPGFQAIKVLEDARVEFEHERVYAQARFRGIPVSAIAHVELETVLYPHLDAVLDRVTVWKIPLPGWLLGKAHVQALWLYPIPTFPGKIAIERVTIADRRLQVS